MKYPIIFLLILASFQLIGQAPGFSKTYSFEPEMLSDAFVNISVDNDTLVMFGSATPAAAPIPQLLFFVKMDTNGNVLLQKTHTDTEMAEFAVSSGFDIIKTSDGGYAIAGANYDTQKGVLVKLTHEGDLEFYKKYDPSPHFLYHTRTVLELDDGFLLSGYKQTQNYDLNVLLIKTDKQGNYLWEKTFGQQGLVDVGGSLIKINDNHFAIGATEGTNLSAGPPFPSTVYSRSVLWEVDSIGSVLAVTKSPKNEQIGIGGLQRINTIKLSR
jgi:hypothetical protein